jgi:hypothetical protein
VIIGVLGLLGGAFLAAKTAGVASAIATGIAWAAANLPLIAMIAVLGLLAFGVLELKDHWKEVDLFFEGLINRWISGLNKVIDIINKVPQALGFKGIGHVGDVNLKTWTEEPGALAGFHAPEHFQKLGEDPETPAWLMPRGGPGAGGAGTTVNHGDVHVREINITSPDAKEAAREVPRSLARYAQSGMVR